MKNNVKSPLVFVLVLLMGLLLVSAVAAAPAAAPAAEPAPETTGRICVNAFSDENGNGQPDPVEGYIAGVTFTVANETAIIGQAVSTGTQEPVCFDNIEPGDYQVAQTLSGRLEATTASNATVTVVAGNTVGLAFGSRLELTPTVDAGAPAAEATAAADSAEATTPTEDAAQDSGASNIITIATIAVIVLVVMVLGGLLFWLLRR